MLNNIPPELRQLNQWVCASADKFPINPRTRQLASPTDPGTWASFEEAKLAGYRHVGFVLSKTDPYSIIDLDQPINDQQKVLHGQLFQMFDSYSELSQSGQGVHIIVRGKVPSGVRRDKCEVYSDARYMICTGNVIRAAGINDYQELLTKLHGEMVSTTQAELFEIEPIITDEQLYQMASTAANRDKFNALWAGQLNGYPSQSEADFALLSILCYYSKSNSQVRRMMRYSKLGKRDKATKNDSYINRCLGKIRARQNVLPLVDFSRLGVSSNKPEDGTDSIRYPPGLVGDLARYIYASAIRPVHEVALAAALSLAAGILGRCYNISSTGLNQYIILLANTGTGKEGGVGGMDALLSSVKETIPTVLEFIGPGSFASGQALIRVLDRTPSFVSVLSDFGLTLAQICDPNAPSHLVQLRKVLLDLFSKSGHNRLLKPSVYSDQEKNTAMVRAPNVTIFGESTPDRFYEAIDFSYISEGLIPRFLVIEYKGLRPPQNPEPFRKPDADLVARLTTACQVAITMRGNDSVCNVNVSSQAKKLLDAFNLLADDKINTAREDVVAQLWNRAHIKALKLAALIAVGCDLHNPIVTPEIATWALDLVSRDIEGMCSKFGKGEIGKGEQAQEADMMKALNKYASLTIEQRLDYNVPVKLSTNPHMIPYAYLKKWCGRHLSFKQDKRGAILALKTVLDDSLKAGHLLQVPPSQAAAELGTSNPVYYLPNR